MVKTNEMMLQMKDEIMHDILAQVEGRISNQKGIKQQNGALP